MDETKIQKLLEALEEVGLMLKRAQLTCEQAEKDLKIRLNERWGVTK